MYITILKVKLEDISELYSNLASIFELKSEKASKLLNSFEFISFLSITYFLEPLQIMKVRAYCCHK